MRKGRKENVTRNASLYRKWTGLTAHCYERKMECTGCVYQESCSKGEPNNKYNMLPLKYAVLMVYTNRGKEGLQRFLKGLIE